MATLILKLIKNFTSPRIPYSRPMYVNAKFKRSVVKYYCNAAVHTAVPFLEGLQRLQVIHN